jgi:hypothetical protein
MKRNIFYSLLVSLICLTQQVTAQCDFNFNTLNTGANMTVLVTPGALSGPLVVGDSIGVFYLDNSGIEVCAGSLEWTGDMVQISAFGDDATTPEKDGFAEGEELVWKARSSSTTYEISSTPSGTYTSNGQLFITGLSYVELSCGVVAVPGCMDENADNYNAEATEDDGSCNYLGCTDAAATNYDADATEDDGSCLYPQEGDCVLPGEWSGNTGANMTIMLPSGFIDELAAVDDEAYVVAFSTISDMLVGSAKVGSEYLAGGQASLTLWGDDTVTPEQDGAEADAPIYFQLVDGTLLYDLEFSGIMQNFAPVSQITYVTQGIASVSNVVKTINCAPAVSGCTDPTAFNYNPAATDDDGSCVAVVLGCMDETYVEYNPLANTDNGTCLTLKVNGCTDEAYLEYNASANTDDGSCTTLKVEGCMDDSYIEYNSNANVDDGSCATLIVEGCTDEDYVEYNSSANVDDGSCATLKVFGCTDEAYLEYDSSANTDDGSCATLIVVGCMDAVACNYNSAANVSDDNCTYAEQYYNCEGSCVNDEDADGICDELEIVGCTDELYLGYDETATDHDQSFCGDLITVDCKDETACNYNPNPIVEEDNSLCQELDDCGVCGGDNSTCAVYVELNLETVVDESTLSNETDSLAFVSNFEALLETQLGLPEGTVEIIEVIVIDNTRADLGVEVKYSITLTEEELEETAYSGTVDNTSFETVVNETMAVVVEEVDFTAPLEFVEGCTDEIACNYFDLANIDDETCTYLDGICETCENALVVDNDSDDDGVCNADELEGCTDVEAFNYDETATDDDGTCIAKVFGCTDNGLEVNGAGIVFDANEDGFDAFNYNPLANTDDGSCITRVFGCILEDSENYNPEANTQDPNEDCIPINYGCNIIGACNYEFNVILDLSLCQFVPAYYTCVWNEDTQLWEQGECENDIDGDGICDETEIAGCTDESMLTYNPEATLHIDSLCTPYIYGCMDESACNYDVLVNTSDDNCTYAQTYYDCANNCINDIDADGVCDELEVLGCTNSLAGNYNPLATEDDGTCELIEGCMDYNYVEYEPSAVVEPIGACVELKVFGCLDVNACNYDVLANTSNNLCTYPTGYSPSNPDAEIVYNCNGDCINDADLDGICDELEIYGCTDVTACNYNALATESDNSCEFASEYYSCFGLCISDIDGDGVCDELEVVGCTDVTACNYNSTATEGDVNEYCEYPKEAYLDCNDNCINDADGNGICDEVDVVGCSDPIALNYNAVATLSNSDLCEYLTGCTIEGMFNYNPDVVIEDNTSCIETVLGCMQTQYLEYSVLANVEDVTACQTYIIEGCTDASANNYNALANLEDYSCTYSAIVGCMDAAYLNFNPDAVISGVCTELIEMGCTNEDYLEYNPAANVDDGSCQNYPYPGCTDPNYIEYSEFYNVEEAGACITIHLEGCMDEDAWNYDPDATTNNQDECILFGCMDPLYAEYYNQGFVATQQLNGSCVSLAVHGCTNTSAYNYMPTANVDNGECSYLTGTDISFEFEPTGATMSILIPTNVLLTGDFNSTNPIPNGTIIGVFYTDENFLQNNQLHCAGSSVMSEGENTPIAAMGDDAITSHQDGFQNGENMIWRMMTPDGLLYNVTPIFNTSASSGSGTGNVFGVNEFSLMAQMQTEFQYQVPVVGCMSPDFSDYNPFATQDGYGGVDNGEPFEDEINNFTLLPGADGLDDDNLYDVNGDGQANPGCFVINESGCTDPAAKNYNSAATTDDGSCYPVIMGCLDVAAFNYITPVGSNFVDVNTHDADLCIPVVEGCIDDIYAYNYVAFTGNPQTDVNTPSECYPKILGCTDPQAYNFNNLENPNEPSEYLGIEGYDVNTDDGSCIQVVEGCMDETAFNYNSNANVEPAYTYTDEQGILHITSVCVPVITGCTDPTALNYQEAIGVDHVDINTPDESLCVFPLDGCTDPDAFNYNPLATSNVANSCIDKIYGCLDVSAFNFNDYDGDGHANAITNIPTQDVNTEYEGACVPVIEGCLYDVNAFNYVAPIGDPFVDVNTTYEGACIEKVEGCTDITAFNFDPSANVLTDCYYNPGCTDDTKLEFWTQGFEADYHIEDSCTVAAQLYCADQWYLEAYIGGDIENGLAEGNVAHISECLTEVVFYCNDENLSAYYPTGNILDGNAEQVLGGNLIDNSLCGEPIEYYCNDATKIGYYGNPELGELSIDDIQIGNVVDPSLCGDDIELYCNDASKIGYYGDPSVSTLTIDDQVLGNLMDESTCGVDTALYCNDDLSISYYATNNVLGGLASDNANLVDNNTCSQVEVDFYCSDETKIGYYNLISNAAEFTIEQRVGTIINDEVECGEDVVRYCNSNEYVEHFADLASFSTTQGNLIDEDLCITPVVYGCTDSTMFNYNAEANVNRTSFDDASSMCVPVIEGCTNELAYNYNDYDNDGVANVLNIENSHLNINTHVEDMCVPVIEGCLNNTLAFNYIPLTGDPLVDVNTDDGSCVNKIFGCTDNGLELNGAGIVNDLDADGLASFNYDEDANIDDGSCIAEILGCTDETAFNYSIIANTDDGSCEAVVLGCTNPEMYNYNADANTNDPANPCIPVVEGCTDEEAFNYNAYANRDDFSCVPVIFGCIYPAAFNYNPSANVYDSSCIAKVYGCTDPTAQNYDETANTDDGTCIEGISGCTDEIASNYNEVATVDDGSCEYYVYGCTNIVAENYNPLATFDNGSCAILGCMNPQAPNYNEEATVPGACVQIILGCTDPLAVNYNPNANVDNDECVDRIEGCMNPEASNYDPLANYQPFTPGICVMDIPGCTDIEAVNYNELATQDNGTCVFSGCTNPSASNFDPIATVNDGSCTFEILGCTDPNALNYSPVANVDNGTCELVVEGCMNPLALNYDANANVSNGSCIAAVVGCTQETALNYNPAANVDDNSCIEIVEGCMNSLAYNYNPNATVNDGSCIAIVEGCMDEAALNFNPLANVDLPSSCISVIIGCMTQGAVNYNPDANFPSGDCQAEVFGCMDVDAINYNPAATSPDEELYPCIAIVYGCTAENSLNYDATATVNQVSAEDQTDPCEYAVYGCTDENYLEYNEVANADDGSCLTEIILGCTENLPWFCNYDADANTNDGSCLLMGDPLCDGESTGDARYAFFFRSEVESKCIDPNATNYFSYLDPNDPNWGTSVLNPDSPNYIEAYADDYVVDNSVCIYVYGCMDPTMYNYDAEATLQQVSADDLSDPCIPFITGCVDSTYLEYNPEANTANASACITVKVEGCTDVNAVNYNANANYNDGSCIDVNLGCMDDTYVEYSPEANSGDQDALCITPLIEGCDNSNFLEYYWIFDAVVDTTSLVADSIPNTGDSAVYCLTPIVYGCSDADYLEYAENVNVDNGTCEVLRIEGCTNPLYVEYNANATVDDGSCAVEVIYGCTDSTYLEYWVYDALAFSITEPNPLYNTDSIPSMCITPIVFGCTNSSADEGYDSTANVDDGSCVIYGCTDTTAYNYNPEATHDDVNNPCSILGCTNENSANYNPNATEDDGTCVANQFGCTDSTYLEYWNYDAINFAITPLEVPADTGDVSIYCFNEIINGCTNFNYVEYNENANVLVEEDCITEIINGCTDDTYAEYHNAEVTPNNGFDAELDAQNNELYCENPAVFGCTDVLYVEYADSNNVDNGSCITLRVDGCTDAEAFNFNAEANTDDGSCEYEGCTDEFAFNFDPTATIDDGSCIDVVFGCPDTNYIEHYDYNPLTFTITNQDPIPNTDSIGTAAALGANGSYCDTEIVYGCADENYLEYSAGSNVNNGACINLRVEGCTDEQYLEYDPGANVDDGSCSVLKIPGCTDDNYVEYWAIDTVTFVASHPNILPNFNDGSCQELVQEGCINELADNYDVNANVHNVSLCTGAVGCTNPNYVEYNENYLVHQQDSCMTVKVYGCTDPSMFNFDELANTLDSSCVEFIYGCLDETAFNFDSLANSTNETVECIERVFGCTDSTAMNYDENANTDFEPNNCIPYNYGCLDLDALNYNDWDGDGYANPITNTSIDINQHVQDSCVAKIYGCMIDTMYNYNPEANIQDDEVEPCIEVVFGCIDNGYEVSGSLAINDLDGDGLDAWNYNPIATTNDGSCITREFGCTDSLAYNYSATANTDDETCAFEGCVNENAFNYTLVLNSAGELVAPTVDIPQGEEGACIVYGCTSEHFPNYNSEATHDDGSCDMLSEDTYGCTDSLYIEYWVYDSDALSISEPNAIASVDNGACVTEIVEGCIDVNAFNYNSAANVSNPSLCEEKVYGCTNSNFVEYYDFEYSDSLQYVISAPLNPANTDTVATSSCITEIVYGCTDIANSNYDTEANVYSFEECLIYACMDDTYLEYNAEATNHVDSLCVTPIVFGCTDPSYIEYYDYDETTLRVSLMDSIPNTENGTCVTEIITGCYYSNFINYNPNVNVYNYYEIPTSIHYNQTIEDICGQIIIYGCTDSSAANYNEQATQDDGTCYYNIEGCTLPIALNYNPNANVDDGSCVPVIYGCTIETFANYNSEATVDDGSCSDETTDIVGCTDSLYYEYNVVATIDATPSACINPHVLGCTDSNAINYNPEATLATNDDCYYVVILGCTNELYLAYDIDATEDDGSCSGELVQFGCTDESAYNYDEDANLDQTSWEDQTSQCIDVIEGCTDQAYLEYWDYDADSYTVSVPTFEVNTDDGSCETLVNVGCIDPNFIEYYAYEFVGGYYVLDSRDESINVANNNFCVTEVIEGCIYDVFYEYNPDANVNNSSFCLTQVEEVCVHEEAQNNFTTFTLVDGIYQDATENITYVQNNQLCLIEGCMNEYFVEYQPYYNIPNNDDCNTLKQVGCQDSLYLESYNYTISNLDLYQLGEFVEDVNFHDASYCETDLIFGCTYSYYTNYNPDANVELGVDACDELADFGCSIPEASNYDEDANFVVEGNNASFNDENCEFTGCTDSNYIEYWDVTTTNDLTTISELEYPANVEDGSCSTTIVYGCMEDGGVINFNALANVNQVSAEDSSSPCIEIITGCTDPTAFNYDSLANTSVDICIDVVEGCINPFALNYYPSANTDNGTCVFEVFGCNDNGEPMLDIVNNLTGAAYPDGQDDDYQYDFDGDSLASFNYDSLATVNNGTCEPIVEGCLDSEMFNYDAVANVSDGSCYPVIEGCLDENYFNYNDYDYDGAPNDITNDVFIDVNTHNEGYCQNMVEGCIDITGDLDGDGLYDNYAIGEDGSPIADNPVANANVDDGSCIYTGCMDEEADNYASWATFEGIIDPCLYGGCTDIDSFNYDPSANVDDGSCIPKVEGCTNSAYLEYWNFDALADTIALQEAVPNVNNGSCLTLIIYGCTNESAYNYNASANVNYEGANNFVNPCVPYNYGCTDSTMFNYDETANYDDGTCIPFIVGCLDEEAMNYDPTANMPGYCDMPVYGCMDDGSLFVDEFNNVTGELGADGFDDDGFYDEDGDGIEAFNFNPNADYPAACVGVIEGCLNPFALNYDPLANTHDDSCVNALYGCMDEEALNYNENANAEGGNCIYAVEGCLNPFATNYNPDANVACDGCCSFGDIEGCTIAIASNYNPAATIDDGSCEFDFVIRMNEVICIDPNAIVGSYNPYGDPNSEVYIGEAYVEAAGWVVDNSTCVYDVEGCMDANAFNYNPAATVQIETTCYYTPGCTDPEADNYEEEADWNVGCLYTISGCMDPNAVNYNPEAIEDDGSCSYVEVYGCTLSEYIEYWDFDASTATISLPDTVANVSDGSCVTQIVFGCTDANAFNYDETANVNQTTATNTTSPCEEIVFGCTDSEAFNFEIYANTDDGSCIEKVFGCTDIAYQEYDSLANTNDETMCVNLHVYGCMDEAAFNYDELASIDDGSCIEKVFGCMDNAYLEYDALANTEDMSMCITLIVEGCTDIAANNFDLAANVDDGSCTYTGCTIEGYENYCADCTETDNTICALGGCQDENAVNYNAFATYEDGSCSPFNTNEVYGCLDDNYLEYYNYDVQDGIYNLNGQFTHLGYVPTIENYTCETLLVYGCTDANADLGSYNSAANVENGTCHYLGCMSDWADNYDPVATDDDGSCDRLGCTSEWADNYDALATTNDGSCTLEACMSVWADNYDENATSDDGSCYKEGCMSDWADNYDAIATIDDGSCDRLGCMSDWADNYDALATTDDGLCALAACIYEWADNYDENATTDDGSCTLEACMSDWADNYDENATSDDGSCYREGCMSPWAENYDELATIDDGSCGLEGCTSEWADNYDENATTDDGSCTLEGCTLDWADNYDTNATSNDGSCYREGCTSEWADNYDALATIDDGSCALEGCTLIWADNYDENATSNDGSCYREGCTSEWADNYDALATIDDGSCGLEGCTSEWADNYDENATTDDGSCTLEGCTSEWADNYDANATSNDGSCYKEGCTSDWADNYDSYATIDDGSCTLEACMSDWADNYDENATSDDGSCYRDGCTSDWADNFDELATSDDGSCYREGCTQSNMFNYDPLATIDDDSCTEFIYGCMNPVAINYNPEANTGEGITCLIQGCTDELAITYDSLANIHVADSCIYLGCTNELACNYSEIANQDDESCEFPEQYYDCDSVCISDVDGDGICDELEDYGCTDSLALNYDSLATQENGSCHYELEVELIVHNASCRGGAGSVEVVTTGGIAPITVNSFGLDLTSIPPGSGYILNVTDGAGTSLFLPAFDITEPDEYLQVSINYNENDQLISFETNANEYVFDWHFNNVSQDIEEESFTPEENGLYSISLTDEYGCVRYESVDVTHVGVEELTLELLEIYPNPTTGILNVNYKLEEEGSTTIKVINMTGVELYNIEYENVSTVKEVLQLTELSAGVYFIQIEADGRKLYRRILIK